MGYLGNQITTVFPTSISVDTATISGNTTVGGTLGVTGVSTLSDNIVFGASGKGVHLGVTSATASNLIDDFEEGTWTPAFSASSAPTVGYSTQEGKYTKIGQTVIFHCKLLTSSKSGGSGALFITGLPFANSAVAAGAVVAGYFTGENPMKWRTSSSNIFLYYRGALTGNDFINNSQTSDLNTSSGANSVEISGVYFTDS